MNRIKFFIALSFLILSFVGCGPMTGFHTANLPLSGNCDQCETLIEDAVNKKKVAHVNWDATTQQAYILFNPKKISITEIQKRIAYAGWDTPLFRTPDEVYAALPACCKYKRALVNSREELAHASQHSQEKPIAPDQADAHKGHENRAITQPELTPAKSAENAHALHSQSKPKETELNKQTDSHAGHTSATKKTNVPVKAQEKPAIKTTPQAKPSAAGSNKETHVLQPVYANYFKLKDALVKDDSKTAAASAAALEKAVSAVPMSKMSDAQHDVWMKYYKALQTQAGQIARSKSLANQRTAFAALSANLEPVVKAFKPAGTVYLQHCPMFNNNKGANWLSQEKAIKNPFYGPAMLSCGKTLETIR